MNLLEELVLADGAIQNQMCPCRRPFRYLAQSTSSEPVVLWKVLYTCAVLLGMLIALLSDRVGADMVMLMSLTAFMAAGIITVS